jgi:hypothetical protein
MECWASLPPHWRALIDPHLVRAPRLRRGGRWMPSRRCASDAYLKDIWAPTRRQREYIEAYRTVVREGRRPTLALIAQQLGVRRQTVWQMEQLPAFRAGLLGSLRQARRCLWHEWAGNTDVTATEM